MWWIHNFKLREDELFINNEPKVIILLWKNWSWKTTILSTISDFLYEAENIFFTDILPKNWLWYSFYKMWWWLNRKIWTEYYYAFAEIRQNINNSTNYNYYWYIDKNWNISAEQIENNIWKTIDKNIKESWQLKNKFITVNKQDETIKNDIINNSYCLFPSNRFEIPYWENNKALSSWTILDDWIKIENQLNKPLLISTSLRDIKWWIMDLYLDSNIKPKDIRYNQEIKKFFTNMEIPTNNIIFTNGLTNIEKILSKILWFNAKLVLNLRGNNNSRLRIFNDEKKETFIPWLDNLSAGQSALLVLFLTIMRYSDKVNLYKCIWLDQIEWIVVIDEIDLHLDINLQKNILPELISLFPKVQFIITTHSPFFLYWMSQKFDNNKLLMIDITDSKKLECFDEFNEIWEAYEIFDNIYWFAENNIDYNKIILWWENETVEFKSSFKRNIEEKKKDKNILHEVIKTIAWFLNSEWWTLLVWVDDMWTVLWMENDIMSYKHSNRDSLFKDVSNMLMEFFSKKIHHINVKKTEINWKEILIFKVRKSLLPHFIEWEDNNEFYIRVASSTRKLKDNDLISYLNEHF